MHLRIRLSLCFFLKMAATEGRREDRGTSFYFVTLIYENASGEGLIWGPPHTFVKRAWGGSPVAAALTRSGPTAGPKRPARSVVPVITTTTAGLKALIRDLPKESQGYRTTIEGTRVVPPRHLSALGYTLNPRPLQAAPSKEARRRPKE